jgi:tRNA-binding protein
MDVPSAFATLDIRVGTVRHATRLANVRKVAYHLIVDFGESIGQRASAAQITELYEPHDLVGKQVLGVVNLPPKRMGPFTSEVLVLGVPDEAGRVVLVVPERAAPDGAKLF